MKGIEPSYSAWEAAALPLSYTRFSVTRALISSPFCKAFYRGLGQSPGQCHGDGAVVNVAFADFCEPGVAPADQIGPLRRFQGDTR